MNDITERRRVRAKVLYHLSKKCDINSGGEALKLYFFFKNIKITSFPISFLESNVVLEQLKAQMPIISDVRVNYLGGLIANAYGRTRMFSGRVEKGKIPFFSGKRKVYKQFGIQK